MTPKTLVVGQEGSISKSGFSGQESGRVIIFGGYAEEKFGRAETVLIALSNMIDDQIAKNDSVLFAVSVFQEDTRSVTEDEQKADASVSADAPSRTEAVVIRNS